VVGNVFVVQDNETRVLGSLQSLCASE
jgi:hypothetical protein